MDPVEEVLHGGNVSGEVVRVGATVRKPLTAATPAVEAFLEHLEQAEFGAAPRSLGRDERGRHVLEYVPGRSADNLPALGDAQLVRLGSIVRELHDASSGFLPPAAAEWSVAIPPDREELICHNDLAPWNLVIDGDRWVFIDWDGAGPGSRLWDLAYVAHGFVPLWPGGDVERCCQRLRALARGYGLTEPQRRELPPLITAHVRGMYRLLRDGARTGRQPWSRLHADGHGELWRAAADWNELHQQVWASALAG